jgi:biopolymer transport protein ExbD
MEGVVAEVNVTSLVDVTMMLLIIFILVAPILVQGIEIDLPDAATSTARPDSGLRVSIGPGGEIFLDGAPTMPADLDAALAARAAASPDIPVLVEADGEVEYRVVMDILDRARGAGLRQVSLATEPERGVR